MLFFVQIWLVSEECCVVKLAEVSYLAKTSNSLKCRLNTLGREKNDTTESSRLFIKPITYTLNDFNAIS